VIDGDLSAVEAGEQFGFFDPIHGWGLAAHNHNAILALNELEKALNLGSVGEARNALNRFLANRLDVDSHKANVMVSNHDGIEAFDLLGVVGSGYQTCQNRELAEFTDALAQTGKVVIETAGTIQNGKRIWFLARGESFEVGSGDEVFSYVMVSNAHDGSSAIRVTPTTVRVVCSNTFHMVVPRVEDGSTRVESAALALRHSGDLMSKLAEARNAIRHYGEILSINKSLFNRLQEQKISRDKALEFFAGQYTQLGWAIPTKEELGSSDKDVQKLAERRERKMKRAAADFLKRYDAEKELAGGESAWLAFNAMTGVLQHDIASTGADDEARIENRIKSNLFGVGADRAQNVFEAALAIA
jgi:phage/plasmid-like protein (TIGR03299 family)